MINLGDLIKEAQKQQGKPKNAGGKPAVNADPRPNMGWLFYKDYYLKTASGGSRVFNSDLGEIKKLKKQIESARNPQERTSLEDRKKQVEKWISAFFNQKNTALLHLRPDAAAKPLFNLETGQTLPPLRTGDKGMLVGTGYAHETGELGEFKLGLLFDYTTGQPYLPGSSVKGLLRSWFPGYRRTDGKNLGAAYRDTRVRVLKKCLGHLWQKDGPALAGELNLRVQRWLRDPQAQLGDRYFEWLERQIFEGESLDIDEKTGNIRRTTDGEPSLVPMPMRDRDLFFDAYIHSASGSLLAEDVITPHRKPLQDPVPLLFVKIAPGVHWQLQFQLSGSELMSADEKRQLFNLLLTTFGAGAKRRHGFGELIETVKKEN